MKKSKIGKLAALLAASSLLFGGFFTSCSSDSDGGSSSVSVTGVELNKTFLSIEVESTSQLTATVLPTNATNQKVTWKSGNQDFASVDENGLVTAKAIGSTTILVTTVDGNKTATCDVSVIEKDTSYYDNVIIVNFDSVQTLGSSGSVNIYNGDTLVDTVSVADEKLYGIGSSKGAIKELNIADQGIIVDGTNVVITTHLDSDGYSKLAANTTYTVKFDESLISGAPEKTFTTKSNSGISGNVINVGSDGNFTTIQGAFNYLRKTEATGDWTINVAAGNYHENLFYYGSANVKLVGADSDNYGDKTYVYWRNSQVLNGAQRARQSFIWQGGNLTIENMTFENTTNRKVEGNTNVQAETLVFDVTKDLVVYNSSFISFQDTLLIGNNGGRAWFYNCYVSGDVDFIWGTADVCLLENCKIVCRADGIKNDAKIFASRTVADVSKKNTVSKGFILMNSDIEVEDGCSAAYGRSSGADTQAAVFNNKFTKGAPISSLWGSASDTRFYEPNGEMAVGYKDYNNKNSDGSVIDTTNRCTNTADMSERLYNREYNGRWVIFNRVYNLNTNAYEFVSDDNIYDITTIANGYNADEETSIDNIYVEPVYSDNVVGGNNVSLTISTKASSLTYTYKTNDSSLATVADGIISTVSDADGTVTITVTASNGKTDTAYVKVIPTLITVSGISLNDISSVDLYSLNTITATITPEDASDKSLVWTATGNIKIVDPTSKTLVTTLETTGNTVQIEGIESGEGTISVKSLANETITDSKTITVTDVRDYNADEAVAVNSKDVFGILNFQSGKTGIWHDIYVHAIYDKTNGKIAASGERIQSRYGTLYIPVTDSCIIDMTCQAYSDSVEFTTDFMDASGAAPTTSTGDDNEGVYKYHYTWEYDAVNDTSKQVSGTTVKTLFDAATKDTNRSLSGAAPDVNATYFAIHIPGADRYIKAIKITKDSSIYHEPISATLTIGDFAESTKTLDLNGTTTVTQTVSATSSDSAEPVITYSSANESIATVDSSTGEVTAKAIGEVSITATASHPSNNNVVAKKTSYTVHVSNSGAPETTYSIDLAHTEGTAGDYGIMKTTTTGSSAAYHNDHGWRFASGDTLSVKVAGASTIKLGKCQYGVNLPTADNANATSSTTGNKPSTCGTETMDFVYLPAESGTVTFTFSGQAYIPSVSVEPYTAPTVTLSVDSFAESTKTLDLNGTTTVTQTTTASASDETEVTLKYTSSKEGVATVDESTGKVTAVSIGQTTISATAYKDGCENVVATYTVLVKNTETPTAGYSVDFASGNIFTAYCNTLDFGILKVNPDNTNAYGYNGTQHGAMFKDGNSVELKVPAGAVVKVQDCMYNNATSITATVDKGSVSPSDAQTMTGSGNNGSKTCSSTTDFTVTDACTITLAFVGSTTYVSKIEVTVSE